MGSEVIYAVNIFGWLSPKQTSWQCILHPEQDRVLTIRENARLQGFPDCYKLYGPIKERYVIYKN